MGKNAQNANLEYTSGLSEFGEWLSGEQNPLHRILQQVH